MAHIKLNWYIYGERKRIVQFRFSITIRLFAEANSD